ncbi:flagellar biosynthesis protein [Campylobacter pinnipediorum]|uniref:Flagellar biosynthesis protein n=1 Tax=Campylobacter pinnipediorum subsp. pinnipediorum TaxID=1660067 RepID=A0AAX0LAV4_9BACT|nr:flagellar biosynthesis protein [Campylobacter pinnipediorum]AQW81761.1 hypothetical protein CPIN17260_1484 [Campylobacter pinnipediorum subsp. pinnipediorum]AQW83437.1 hypothetical protein CPIN17261_1445 [Campylobacter pinnipediorum subsp. pinnipediorum]AQW84958.1 hypothetical protein CPIN17262_1290 [Campylobacter pinnipediorum subsp. pinnipediorum]OPA79810.1 flagellar biosynthesis protein [Campylobacter pinnipediorum subsp. pinnipediorum]OPA81585.1 flagellar biosynthesis protein [Campyloba
MKFLPWIIIIILAYIVYYLSTKYERKIKILEKLIDQNKNNIAENKDLIEKNRLLIEKNKHSIETNKQNITKIDIDIED